jgi:hypothetical protein
MDGQCFDALAKQFATGLPRRAVLRALGAAAVGLLAATRPGRVAACGAVGDGCGSSADCCAPGVCCNGQCVPACTATNQCHDAVLDPGTCGCTQVPKPENTACDDGNACTRDDVCIQGVCVGRDHVECSGAANQCKLRGTCDPATGLCNKGGNVADGTPCNDGDPCSRTSTCQGGQCVGTDYVLTCAKGFVCIKDVNGQFICARKNDVKAIDQHAG